MYIVETRFVNHWENAWTENEQPLTFATRAEAQEAIFELILEAPDYSFKDYRIVKTQPIGA